jgi:hypothetical protein
MELFQAEEDSVSLAGSSCHDADQLFLTLSTAAVAGTATNHTMCLDGAIQNHPVKILVDSGSSHTFISEQLAANLSGIVPVSSPLSVQVANGQKLQCVSVLPEANWSVDSYQFQSDLKILPLSTYDMILGLDYWLAQFSPMKIN